jgi:oligosaccharide repeat unit polymerase
MELTKLASIFFAGIILVMTVFEKRRLNTIITPFSLSAWPLVFIILAVNFLLVKMEFNIVTPRAILFLLANLFIVWLIGIIFSYIYNYDSMQSFDDIFLPYVKYEKILIVLAWIVNIVVFLKVKNLLAKYGGLSFMGDYKFEEMINRGLEAHISQFGKVTFILLSFIYPMAKHKITILITLFGLIVMLFLLQVKYNLIGVLVVVLIYFNFTKPIKKQLYNILKFSLLTIMLMAIFLIVLTIVWGTFAVSKQSVWLFVSKNLLSYFFSSPIVLDKWLDHAFVQPDWTLLLLFKNIFNRIIGNPLIYDSLDYVDLNFSEVADGVYSNVGTSYGVYFIIGGWVFSLFMSAIISFVTYFIFFNTIKKPSPINIFLCLTLLNIVLFSLFGQYFTLLPYYEMIIFYIITIKAMDIYNSFVADSQNSLLLRKV